MEESQKQKTGSSKSVDLSLISDNIDLRTSSSEEGKDSKANSTAK